MTLIKNSILIYVCQKVGSEKYYYLYFPLIIFLMYFSAINSSIFAMLLYYLSLNNVTIMIESVEIRRRLERTTLLFRIILFIMIRIQNNYGINHIKPLS